MYKGVLLIRFVKGTNTPTFDDTQTLLSPQLMVRLKV